MKLVLLHGWGFDGRIWDELRTELSLLGRESQRLDLPGYGGTANAACRHIEQLADFLLAHTPRGSAIIGWSLGAMTALAAAAKAPQHFTQLILIGASASFVYRDGWADALEPALLDGFRTALANDSNKLLTRFAALCNQGHQDHGDGQLTARMLARRLANQHDLPPSPMALADGLQALVDTDLRPLLPSVRQPTLLLHGEHDRLMPMAAARQLAEHLPAARLEILAGAAHAPFLSAPAQCAALIHAFTQTA